jgi:hypothetical protein
MAKKKAKVKAKAKTKTKTKVKAKAKAKASVKAKPKVQAKTKAKPKAKGRHNGPPPPSVTPGMCDPFTAQTGWGVIWQSPPIGGCYVSQIPGDIWPFTPVVPPPNRLFVPQLNPGQIPNTHIAVGSGSYQVNVECCQNQMPKTVTVP